jgi:glycosyltransferase involved in cell wall biosynthesis
MRQETLTLTSAPHDSTVSIIIPFYNPPLQFFTEAIDSVLRQTYQDWELILVNDGSCADATAIAREYRDRYPGRIRLIEHPDRRNAGLRASRCLGFQHADGTYVALLDADDLWLPNKLEDQIALLDRYPDVGLLYGNSLYWRTWEHNGGEDFEPDLGVSSDTCVEPPTLVPLFLSGRIAVPCPSSMVSRRSAIVAAGGFEGEFQNIYEDQVFLMKMCFYTPVLIVPQTWDYYRLHQRSITSRSSDDAMTMARRTFLQWLSAFMDQHGSVQKDVRDAIVAELWNLEHPVRARLNRFFRKRFGRREQLRGRTVV